MAARLDFLLQLPGVDVLRIACAGFSRRMERNGFIPGQCAVRGMLEEKVDALVLHPPRDKAAIAFVELSAAVPAAIAARAFLSQRMAIDANTCSMMSGTVWFWKMRKSLLRVASHSQGLRRALQA
ncbi:hypothetical protein MI467_07515 [Delftia acidovorans]|nr:hypothetical protein [Delftia acidovorans]